MLITGVINVFSKLIVPLMDGMYTDQIYLQIHTKPETAARIDGRCEHSFLAPFVHRISF